MIATRKMVLLFGGVLATLAAIASAGNAGEKVGKARKIDVTVTGAAGSINTGDPVHRNEHVRVNVSGLGQFEFDDGTKLVMGPNSSIVIDKYVLGEGGKVKKFTIRATKGAFRFISGRNPTATYTIVTPAGTMGVRG